MYLEDTTRMRERIGFRLLGVVAGGCVLYLLLFGVVYFGMAREGFFLSAIHVSKMEDRWGMQEDDVHFAINQMLTYVKSWDESIEPQYQMEINGEMTDFYTKRELLHLHDVQKLMKNFSVAALVLLVVGMASLVVLMWKKRYADMAYGYIYVLLLVLVLLIVVGIISLIDLQWLINGFHKLLFENNAWVLNPAKDKLVWFFPKAVYRKAVVYLAAVAVVIFSMLIGAVCYIKKYYVNFLKKR